MELSQLIFSEVLHDDQLLPHRRSSRKDTVLRMTITTQCGCALLQGILLKDEKYFPHNYTSGHRTWLSSWLQRQSLKRYCRVYCRGPLYYLICRLLKVIMILWKLQYRAARRCARQMLWSQHHGTPTLCKEDIQHYLNAHTEEGELNVEGRLHGFLGCQI
jgi:hypothetical protein